LDVSLSQALHGFKYGLPTVMVVYGSSDRFALQLLEQAWRDEIKAIREQGECVRYEWPETSLRQATQEAYSGSLFGERMLVSVRGVDCLTTGYKGKLSEEEASALQSVVDEMPAHPIIFYTSGEKLDERRKVVKALQAASHVHMVSLTKQSEDDRRVLLERWLGRDLILTVPQRQELLRRTHGSLGGLYNEVEKLRLFAHSSGRVSDDDLDMLVVGDSQPDVFSLIRNLVNGDIVSAYTQYKAMPPTESTFGLLVLIARQFRLIAIVHDKTHGAMSDARLAGLTGVHPYAVKMAREQSRKTSIHSCLRFLGEVVEIEYAIKSGRIQEHLAMDLFFMKRLGEQGPAV